MRPSPTGRSGNRKSSGRSPSSAFFIPIVSPGALASTNCEFEFKGFLNREQALGRDDLVFPILYIRVPDLASAEQRRHNAVLNIIHTRQYADWTKIRQDDPASSPEVRRQIELYCQDIVEALRKPWESPQDRRRREEAEASRLAEETRRRASPPFGFLGAPSRSGDFMLQPISSRCSMADKNTTRIEMLQLGGHHA